MTAAPVISTERLTLRAYRLEDWPLYRDMLGGPRSAFLGGPYGAMEAWGWFCSEVAQWDFFGHGALHAERNGTVVGQANIVNPPDWPETEIGFWVYEGHEGEGYASEAARGLRDWYYAEHPAPKRLVSYVHPENAASARLVARLGAVLDPARRAPFEGYGVYVHPAPERVQ